MGFLLFIVLVFVLTAVNPRWLKYLFILMGFFYFLPILLKGKIWGLITFAIYLAIVFIAVLMSKPKTKRISHRSAR